MKRLVDGEMSSASPSLRFAVGIEVKASSNSTQPQPSAPPPDLQSSSPPLPPNATQSPPPPSEPPMASAPPNLSPPLEPTVSPPSPPSSPPPKSPPPLDDPPANSPPPPPVDPSHPLPPPVDPPHLPPPPSTNHPPPSPPVTKSPPAKPPESPLPPPSPPPPPRKSPPPPPRQSPPPPSISPLISPQPPSILKSPPPRTIWSPPSRPPSPRGTSSTDTSSVNGSKNSNSISDEGIGTGAIVILALVFGLLVLAIVGAACCRRGRKKFCGRNSGYIMPTSSHKSDPALRMSRHKNGSGSAMNIICPPLEPCGFGNSRSWFNYEELVQATNGFSAQNLLGEGGFGSVYKGVLADGRDVAVKQLKIGGGQGDREFRSEVEIISRIHHRHLVSLVGYCINENRRLLVYDYVLNNNLYFHLHGEGRPVLNWSLRVKIYLGAARGIAYLHEDCHPRIIHRDIKSSNILLDSNFEARVSDFGLAKLALDANTHVSTRVMGTFGYMAPEYASSGKLTERSDVYSFGVVLLELITGRKPIDNSQPVEAENLVEWAQPLLSQAIETQDLRRLVDPRLESQYVDSEMLRMIEAAAACVRHSVIKRPKMRQVVRALDTMATTDLTNGMRVGESRAADSAEIRLFRRMAFGTQEDFSSGFFDS